MHPNYIDKCTILDIEDFLEDAFTTDFNVICEDDSIPEVETLQTIFTTRSFHSYITYKGCLYDNELP
jgi:hypothetical protein